MKRIKEYTFSGLIKLRELICTYNPNLREINERAFKLPANKSIKNSESKFLSDLNTIELNNNMISKLSKNFFDIKQLVKLDLSSNPLKCNQNLNFLLEILNRTVLLNQKQTNCSTPTKFAGQSFYDFRMMGLNQFDKDRFINEDHQAFFGLICVIIISVLIVCSLCILKAMRINERFQKSMHSYHEYSGFRISLWNCFNCCGLFKNKGFYKAHFDPQQNEDQEWDQELDLESSHTVH